VGTGRRMFKLPEPYLFNVEDKERRIVCRVKNITASPNTIRLTLVGRRYYIRDAKPDIDVLIGDSIGRRWRTNTYFLVPKEVDKFGIPPTLAGNGSARRTFVMDNDADTSIMKLMAVSTGAFSFRIKEEDTNRELSNGTLHSDNGWGTADFPFFLSDSWFIERNKRLFVDITDLTGANNVIYLTMAGRRLELR